MSLARSPTLGAPLGAAVLALALAGCECTAHDAASPMRAPSVGAVRAAAPSEGEIVAVQELPATEAARATAMVPMLTIEVSALGYRVDNRALVESWPPAERERVAASAPPGVTDFPVVETSVPFVDDGPLLVQGVRDALARALEGERVRSGRDVTPQAFAIRAPATLAWARIERAVFTAAMAGLTEPAIVVRTDAGERLLRLARPVLGAPGASPVRTSDLGEALGAAVRALPPAGAAPAGIVVEPATVEPATDVRAPLTLSLEAAGLRVRRGPVELGVGCGTPSAEATPAIPLLALGDGHSLSDCLTALGEGATRFSASAEVTLGTATVVLEALAARGPVEIVMAGR